MTHRLPAPFLLSLALALPLAASAAPPKPVEFEFLTRVSVDASGQVTGTEFVRPVPEALQPLVAKAAAGVAFEPATRDGVPVPSRTALELRMRFTPEGDDFRVEVLSVDGGAAAGVGTRVPNFPVEVMRDGHNVVAVAEVVLQADGSVDLAASKVERVEFYRGTKADQSPRAGKVRLVRESVQAAMKDWTYIVEEVDGLPVATTLQVPVTMCRAPRGADGREDCRLWNEAIRRDLQAPQPADTRLRLAQPRLPAPAVPAA